MTGIDFSKLECKRGSATKLVGFLEEVSTYDGQTATRGHRGTEPEAYEQLMVQLVGSNEWYSASGPALDWLLTNVNNGARRDITLALAGDIACADHVNAWLTPPDQVRIPESILEVLTKHRATVWNALSDEDERTRAAAALLAGCVDGWGGAFRARLWELVETDPSVQVRASSVLAVARVAAGAPEVQGAVGTHGAPEVQGAAGTQGAIGLRSSLWTLSRSPGLEPLLRGAAAIAWLRADPNAEFDACAESLGDWLASSLHDGATTLHWFGAVRRSWTASGQLLSATARALAALARARGAEEKVIRLALDAVAKPRSGTLLHSVSTLVLELGGFVSTPGKITKTLAPSEFSASQQQLLPLLAHAPVPIAAGYGLPAAGANRRRWFGVEPPGPLERSYEELNGQPLWRACQEGPVPLPPSLTGFARWQALLELRANPYARAPQHNIDSELAQLTAEPAWYDAISTVIDEIASRADIARMVVPPPLTIGRAFGDTAMLPLLRADLPVQDRWLFYAWSPNREVNPQLLRLLPLAQREQVLCRIFTNHPESWILDDLQHVSLAPTPTVVTAAIALLKEASEGDWLDMETYVNHVRALVPDHPFVADALREAGFGG